jgi:hypothetical protein
MVMVRPARDHQAEVMAPCSKCLSQGNEVLSSFDSRRSVQVVTDIYPDRADRSGIAKSEAEGVRILSVKANVGKHVAAIVKPDDTKVLLDWYRYAKFRINDK